MVVVIIMSVSVVWPLVFPLMLMGLMVVGLMLFLVSSASLNRVLGVEMGSSYFAAILHDLRANASKFHTRKIEEKKDHENATKI